VKLINKNVFLIHKKALVFVSSTLKQHFNTLKVF